jgi:hypothetical protein
VREAGRGGAFPRAGQHRLGQIDAEHAARGPDAFAGRRRELRQRRVAVRPDLAVEPLLVDDPERPRLLVPERALLDVRLGHAPTIAADPYPRGGSSVGDAGGGGASGAGARPSTSFSASAPRPVSRSMRAR